MARILAVRRSFHSGSDGAPGVEVRFAKQLLFVRAHSGDTRRRVSGIRSSNDVEISIRCRCGYRAHSVERGLERFQSWPVRLQRLLCRLDSVGTLEDSRPSAASAKYLEASRNLSEVEVNVVC